MSLQPRRAEDGKGDGRTENVMFQWTVVFPLEGFVCGWSSKNRAPCLGSGNEGDSLSRWSLWTWESPPESVKGVLFERACRFITHTAKPSKCRATCQSRRELPASQLWPLPLPSWILAQTPLAARPVLRPQPRTRPWPHAWILTAFPRHLAAPRLGSVRLPSPGSPPATPRGSTS